MEKIARFMEMFWLALAVITAGWALYVLYGVNSNAPKRSPMDGDSRRGHAAELRSRTGGRW